MRALAVIQDALEGIGVYAPGESITDADAERSFIVLNDLLDQWSNENLACFANLTQSIVLVNNKNQYTVGPGGDVDGVRPLAISQIYMIDALGNKYQVNLRTQYDWNLIVNTQVTAQLPSDAFYDRQDPVGIINVWPTPRVPLYTMYWTSALQLTAFTNLNTDFPFPRGYVPALKANLMVRLCKYFGKQVMPDVKAEADETRGTIKRTNMQPQPSAYDAEIVSRSSSTYNIRSDSYSNIR